MARVPGCVSEREGSKRFRPPGRKPRSTLIKVLCGRGQPLSVVASYRYLFIFSRFCGAQNLTMPLPLAISGPSPLFRIYESFFAMNSVFAHFSVTLPLSFMLQSFSGVCRTICFSRRSAEFRDPPCEQAVLAAPAGPGLLSTGTRLRSKMLRADHNYRASGLVRHFDGIYCACCVRAFACFSPQSYQLHSVPRIPARARPHLTWVWVRRRTTIQGMRTNSRAPLVVATLIFRFPAMWTL